MMKKAYIPPILLIICFFVSQVLYAQPSFTRTMNPVVTVQPVISLSLTQNIPSTVNFASSNSYLNGITSLGFCTVAVKSNLPWLVSVSAQNAFFTPASAGADNNMPCSVIALKHAANTNYSSLSTAAQTIRSGMQGDAASSGNTFQMDMQFAPGYLYNPGIYNISLTYTVTNP